MADDEQLIEIPEINGPDWAALSQDDDLTTDPGELGAGARSPDNEPARPTTPVRGHVAYVSVPLGPSVWALGQAWLSQQAARYKAMQARGRGEDQSEEGLYLGHVLQLPAPLQLQEYVEGACGRDAWADERRRESEREYDFASFFAGKSFRRLLRDDVARGQEDAWRQRTRNLREAQRRRLADRFPDLTANEIEDALGPLSEDE